MVSLDTILKAWKSGTQYTYTPLPDNHNVHALTTQMNIIHP